jgi:hypothetical protein
MIMMKPERASAPGVEGRLPSHDLLLDRAATRSPNLLSIRVDSRSDPRRR